MGEVVAGNGEVDVQQSLDFFTNPDHYVRFSHTKDKKVIVGCIDPRDEVADELKITMQTPGGAYGEGHDAALALTVDTGELARLDLGIVVDAGTRRISDVVDAHEDCKFLNSLAVVMAEEYEPSDFTKGTLERWARLYDRWDAISQHLPKLRDAAGAHVEFLAENDITAQAQVAVDGAYPGHENFRYMKGANTAKIYVVNHHPNVGLDRQAKHREHGLQIQGYHDSLSAMVNTLEQRRKLSRHQKSLRMAAMFLRSAATRTVIGSGQPDTHYLEAFPSDHVSGMEIVDLNEALGRFAP